MAKRVVLVIEYICILLNSTNVSRNRNSSHGLSPVEVLRTKCQRIDSPVRVHVSICRGVKCDSQMKTTTHETRLLCPYVMPHAMTLRSVIDLLYFS